mgnify:CR=1 FL=1
MYSIKTWNTQTSQPKLRTGLPYALAYAMAISGCYAKAQVIDQEFDTIILETRYDFHQEPQP